MFTGCLENELVQILVDYLVVGNEEVRLDMLRCLSHARGIVFINKVMIIEMSMSMSMHHCLCLCVSTERGDEEIDVAVKIFRPIHFLRRLTLPAQL